jgi:deoxyribonuclease (pyrimidine dimer)
MTRINAGIRPAELVDQHLLAELREIKRIPNVVKQGKAKLDGIPERFSLGTGHVRFFYNKLGYLLRRYRSLYA